MQGTFTKEATQCYTELPLPDHRPVLLRRPVTRVNHFAQRVFASQDRIDQVTIMQALLDIQAALDRDKTTGSTQCSLITRPSKATRKDTVNRKRRLIKQVILNQTYSSVADIARYTKTSRDTVKRVMSDLAMQGDVTEYEYNNIKSQEQVDQLQATLSEVPETFLTVSTIKRRHPEFSRKKILEALHDRGYRYRLLPKERKDEKKRPVNSTRVCRLISHIAQAVLDTETTILYIDEMKFPLYQTAERRWMPVDRPKDEMMVYNRRPVDDKSLTAIALCSLHGFEAVQIFEHEVTGPDFLYFLNEAIAQLPANRHYSIITDNATWHHAKIVSGSAASAFLYFNEPKLYQLNVIENAFSYVRHAFRARPMVETLEDEAKNIVDIFFDKANRDRFRGFFRQHVRNLLEFLERHQLK